MNTSKSILVIIALSFIAFTFSDTLPAGRKLKCADDLKLKSCYAEDIDGTGALTTYVKSCSKGKLCRQTYVENVADGVHDEVENENDFRVQPLGICVKVLKLKNQDEKCEASIECKWGFCVDGKCKAVEDGGTCTSEKDCSSISYCKLPTGSTIGVCAALVAAGRL